MPPMHTQTVADARGAMLALGAMGGEPEPVANVEDREIPGQEGQISVRIYTPEGKVHFQYSSSFMAVVGLSAISKVMMPSVVR